MVLKIILVNYEKSSLDERIKGTKANIFYYLSGLALLVSCLILLSKVFQDFLARFS